MILVILSEKILVNFYIRKIFKFIKDAFQNFQKLNLMRQLYDFSPSISMLPECSGYLRNIACWSEFPACVDNGDTTWVIKLTFNKI